MKICPKCRGYHFDDEDMCADCKIKLMDKQDFTKIICALDKMTPEERRKVAHSAPYDNICKYHFSNEYGHIEKTSKTHKNGTSNPTENINIPRCPTCGSTNVEPISHLRKLGGLLTIGLASKSVGKTYRCLDCKYYW